MRHALTFALVLLAGLPAEAGPIRELFGRRAYNNRMAYRYGGFPARVPAYYGPSYYPPPGVMYGGQVPVQAPCQMPAAPPASSECHPAAQWVAGSACQTCPGGSRPSR